MGLRDVPVYGGLGREFIETDCTAVANAFMNQ